MSMEVDTAASASTSGPACCEKKRFEVKKWNAVALWAWDIVVDNCAICRNHIMGEIVLQSVGSSEVLGSILTRI